MRGGKLPTAQQEADDPPAADVVYEACGAFLRDKTRDQKKFPLVFEENCNYGLRRNLWGMKPIGIAIATLGIAAVGVILLIDPTVRSGSRAGVAALAAAVNVLLLLGWI